MLQEQEKQFIEQDSFYDLESLKIKIHIAVLLSGYFKLFKDDAIEFHCISKNCPDFNSVPKLIV